MNRTAWTTGPASRWRSSAGESQDNRCKSVDFAICSKESFQIRNPKFEIRNKLQKQKTTNPKRRRHASRSMASPFGICLFGFWNLFRVSNFGFRIYNGSIATIACNLLIRAIPLGFREVGNIRAIRGEKECRPTVPWPVRIVLGRRGGIGLVRWRGLPRRPRRRGGICRPAGSRRPGAARRGTSSPV